MDVSWYKQCEIIVFGVFRSVFNCVRDSKRDTKQKNKYKNKNFGP